ncbi:hypothetical protein M0R04_13495 [Candidatus Dojkabacteria bacterium]|jgi:hypothetical protein|nr:hypothetical protein [Candidatus Dojkabacteria bacterium]
MADEQIVEPVQGADDQSPASPANLGGQTIEESNEQVVPLVNQSPEEVEFNNLSGNTQERVLTLLERTKKAEEERDFYKSQNSYVPPAPITPQNPDVQDAVRKLSEVGIATKDDVDRTVDQKLNQIRWENEMGRLQSNYSGEDGKPQFVREEVEDYIRTHPQYIGYTPEDVFKYKMFGDEFTGTVKQEPRRSSTLRPSKQQAQQTAMTVEYIAERTDINKYPDAREWQEEHKAEIDKVLGQMG